MTPAALAAAAVPAAVQALENFVPAALSPAAAAAAVRSALVRPRQHGLSSLPAAVHLAPAAAAPDAGVVPSQHVLKALLGIPYVAVFRVHAADDVAECGPVAD